MEKSQKHRAMWKKPDTNHYWNHINVWLHLYEIFLVKIMVTTDQQLHRVGDCKGYMEAFDGSQNS